MPIAETIHLTVPSGHKIYFASDFHLGAPDRIRSRERERTVVQWLEAIRQDVSALFLVGDVFDYWFEYKHVVPKGHIRLLGKLAALADAGIPIYYFTGNHDMWMRDYLQEELGAVVNRNAVRFEVSAGRKMTSLLVGHGDGLGPGDRVYKGLKQLFESPLARFAYRQLHPDFATRLALAWAKSSRAANNQKGEDQFKGEDQEWLFGYCKEIEAQLHHDYYVFGHRHLALELPVGANSRYINLGEWFSDPNRCPYAVLDENSLRLEFFTP